MGRPKGSTDAPERLLAGALRGFRGGGYGGVGVDALAREAGLTSGAFYAHFGSKAEAFRRAVAEGLAAVREAVAGFQAAHGDAWLPRFVDFYLGELVEIELASACALPTLTGDVGRADDATRAVYRAGMDAIVAQYAEGLTGERRTERATALIALLTGASAIARALGEGEARTALRESVRAQALAIAQG